MEEPAATTTRSGRVVMPSARLVCIRSMSYLKSALVNSVRLWQCWNRNGCHGCRLDGGDDLLRSYSREYAWSGWAWNCLDRVSCRDRFLSRRHQLKSGRNRFRKSKQVLLSKILQQGHRTLNLAHLNVLVIVFIIAMCGYVDWDESLNIEKLLPQRMRL